MSQQYAFEKASMVYMVYFTVLGIISLGAGIIDIVVALSSSSLSMGIVAIPNGGFRGIWGGLVIMFAGIFYLSGIREANEIHRFARVVLASVLLWILAGTDLFSLFAVSIPSDQAHTWFNSWEGFVHSYAPPYTPAVILCPFSLVILYYIHVYHREKGITFHTQKDPVS